MHRGSLAIGVTAVVDFVLGRSTHLWMYIIEGMKEWKNDNFWKMSIFDHFDPLFTYNASKTYFSKVYIIIQESSVTSYWNSHTFLLQSYATSRRKWQSYVRVVHIFIQKLAHRCCMDALILVSQSSQAETFCLWVISSLFAIFFYFQ